MAQASLFDLRMDEITYETVDAFLAEGQRESLRIEYKQPTKDGAIPDNGLEVVTSMSNGIGGLILIGVRDNREHPGYPVAGGWPMLPPRVGQKSSQEDAFLSRIASLIHPRPLVELRYVAPDADAEYGILVARVEPGPTPPYWCAERGILVRHGDQERVADLATIQYLSSRRPESSYTLEQGLVHGWLPAIGSSDPGSQTMINVLLGPEHPVPSPTMSRALDRASQDVFGRGAVLIWLNQEPNEFGETYVKFDKGDEKHAPDAYEVWAHSDGISVWHLPVSNHGDDRTAGPGLEFVHADANATESRERSEAFIMSLQNMTRTLLKAVSLGLEWMGKAQPTYRGAIVGQVQIVNLTHKLLAAQTTSGQRMELLADLPAWEGSLQIDDPRDYLPALQDLFYRFLRAFQCPWLQDEANQYLSLWSREMQESSSDLMWYPM